MGAVAGFADGEPAGRVGLPAAQPTTTATTTIRRKSIRIAAPVAVRTR
jgi:hypothetical protein